MEDYRTCEMLFRFKVREKEGLVFEGDVGSCNELRQESERVRKKEKGERSWKKII
jgi:hypothetical protein